MKALDLMLIAACACAAGGTMALRIAWSQARRSPLLNGIGWSLFLLAAIAAWWAAGAWGGAVAGLAGMGAAALILAHAAASAPEASSAKASNRRVGMLPQQGEPLRLGGRLMTFFIVALAASTVSVGVAIAVRALMHVVGAREADAIVAALFAMPAAWSVLAFILLIQDRRSRQWGTLLLWSVPGVVVLAAEFAA